MTKNSWLLWIVVLMAFAGPMPAHAQKASRTDGALQKSCNTGALADCSELGFRIWESTKTKPDYTTAFKLASKACDQTSTKPTDAEGCALLAILHIEGKGTVKDVKKGEDFALASCSKASRTACVALGIAAEQAQNTSSAMIHYASTCSTTDYTAPTTRAMSLACTGLARVNGKPVCKSSMNSDGATVDACFDEKKRGWNVKVTPLAVPVGAKGGRPVASNTPVDPDQKKYADEVNLLKIECDKNVAENCYRLAEYHYFGRGVPQNKLLAANLLTKACDRTLEPACYALAQMFASGDGIKQNPAGAAELYDYSCMYRNFDACYQIGIIYANGMGVTKNVERAFRAFERACIITSAEAPFADTGKGVPNSCVYLGNAYHEGLGVPQDKPKAYEMWRRALKIDPKNTLALNNLKSMGQTP